MPQAMRPPIDLGIEFVAGKTHSDDANRAQRAGRNLERALLPEGIVVDEHELSHEQQDGGHTLFGDRLVLGELALNLVLDKLDALLVQRFQCQCFFHQHFLKPKNPSRERRALAPARPNP